MLFLFKMLLCYIITFTMTYCITGLAIAFLDRPVLYYTDHAMFYCVHHKLVIGAVILELENC